MIIKLTIICFAGIEVGEEAVVSTPLQSTKAERCAGSSV